MTAMKLTFVYEPPRLPPASMVSGRAEYDRFVDAVGRHANARVVVVEGFLRDVAPADGFILLVGSGHPKLVLSECPDESQSELATRLVPIDVSRPRIFETILEELSVPAAIDGLSLHEWGVADPAKPGAWGPHGRRDIGELVGASCDFYESERYCLLTSATHHGLPHLLVDYLRAYARATSGLRV